jgi:hypothetical protein
VGPLPLIIGAGVAKGIGAIFGFNAQKKAYRENKKAALKNLDLIYDDLNAHEAEERAAALQAREGVELQGDALEGETVTSAAAGNVVGASIDALIRNVARQEAQAKLTIDTNLENTQAQIQRQARGAQLGAIDRINSVQKPSNGALALRIAGIGLDAYSQYKS